MTRSPARKRKTTEQEELFDLLDCAGRKTGLTIGRAEAHAAGEWHGAFHCLICCVREGRTFTLFQKRSREKKIAPGKFDVSVGGHYAAGEGPETAGPREIGEEIGLAVAFDALVPLGRRVSVYCFEPGVREQEFQDVFLLPVPVLPQALRLQKEEVEALLELELEQAIGLFDGMHDSIPGIEIGADGSRKERNVTAAEFVPCLDSYYLKLLVLVRRYAAGERNALVI